MLLTIFALVCHLLAGCLYGTVCLLGNRYGRISTLWRCLKLSKHHKKINPILHAYITGWCDNLIQQLSRAVSKPHSCFPALRSSRCPACLRAAHRSPSGAPTWARRRRTSSTPSGWSACPAPSSPDSTRSQPGRLETSLAGD